VLKEADRLRAQIEGEEASASEAIASEAIASEAIASEAIASAVCASESPRLGSSGDRMLAAA
jgi:hypothetical protein